MASSATALNKPEIVARALGYPYDIRDHSFTLHNGEVSAFDPAATASRHPVIAVGSNRAPQQLKRKFGGREMVPVQHAKLHDHDVVHSAHLSTYGAVPATLRHVEATTVYVGITWLTTVQLAVMHNTELPNGNYDYVQMRGIQLETEHGAALTEAFVYQSTRGHLASEDGAALALAEVSADGRQLAELSQQQALEHARRIVAPHRELHDFIHTTATDRSERRGHISILRERSAEPAHWPHVKVIAAGYESS